MPWQQHVADVVLEVDPDTGLLAYSEFGLTVPRQSGKSVWVLCKAVHRATASGFFGERQRIVYTAQTRNKAREKWQEDYVGDLSRSKTWGHSVKPHLGNGNEHIRFANGSRFGIEANTEKAGHGSTLDEAYIDEAFAQADNRLEQAFRPAMITRQNTQLGWISTAGWLDESPFLESKVARGRQNTELGLRDGLAYFEWSADPDCDPEDRDVWRGCMPALGHTITEAAIAAEFEAMELHDFSRAYLNLWVPKFSADEQALDMAAWKAAQDEKSEALDPVTVGIDIPYDRSTAFISIAGPRTDGRVHVELIPTDKRGTDWVAGFVAEFCEKWKPRGVFLDAVGPAGSLIEDLKRVGVDPTCITSREMAQACAGFHDLIRDDGLRHVGQTDLTAAVGSAKKRSQGDTWVWQRKGTTDSAALIAATVAVAGNGRKPAETKKKRTGRVWT
jgi:hypothetical protein